MKTGGGLLRCLLWSLCISTLEQATQAPYYPIPAGTDTPLISSFVYMIGSGIRGDVCPVLIPGTSREFVIQPDPTGPHLDGQFSTNQSLEDSVFMASTLTQRCQAASSESCDQVLFRTTSAVHRKGSFALRYVPAGGDTIEVDVLYGPAGITYIGEYLRVIPIDKADELTFKLRILSDDLTIPRSSVCESMDGVTFEHSRLLQTTSTFPMVVDTCLQASRVPTFSYPYKIGVRLADSVSDSSELTERVIKVVLDVDCSTNVPFYSSGELTVVGLNATTVQPPPETSQSSTTMASTTTDMNNSSSLSTGDIIGIVMGIVALVILVVSVVLVIVCVYCFISGRHNQGIAAGRCNQGAAAGSVQALHVDGSSSDIHLGYLAREKAEAPESDPEQACATPSSDSLLAILENNTERPSPTIRVISFLKEEDSWNKEFEEKLAAMCGAQPLVPHTILKEEHEEERMHAEPHPSRPDQAMPHTSQQIDQEILMRELSDRDFKLLCFVTDRSQSMSSERLAHVQLLQILTDCPRHKQKVLRVTFGSAKYETTTKEWGTEVHLQQRRSGAETAQVVHSCMQSSFTDGSKSQVTRTEHMLIKKKAASKSLHVPSREKNKKQTHSLEFLDLMHRVDRKLESQEQLLSSIDQKVDSQGQILDRIDHRGGSQEAKIDHLVLAVDYSNSHMDREALGDQS